ncbi:hypothetical protein ACIHDR_47840 [Nocardia sp. NPDC052278]|uniref:hypothetical protein n=1 Tax=unclassified Nocardia TaxID=2637762 RepID=UPI0036A14168
MPATPDPELIFAPVGIAHLTADNTDLLRAAARGKQQLRVTTAAQLNGTPHIGTVVTVLTVFAFTAHAAEQLGLPATVVFDALDNAPAEHLEIGGETYTRTVADLVETGHLDGQARVCGFERLLSWAAARSAVHYDFRPYTVYQQLAPVRACLHMIASRLEQFRPLVAPADGIVRIRPRCPDCRLVEKSARHLAITAGDSAVHLDSYCALHGHYRENIDIAGTHGWYDTTPTPVIFFAALERGPRSPGPV